MSTFSPAARHAVRLAAAGVLISGSVAAGAAAAYAAPGTAHDKVTICHATHAVSHPYVSETVNADSADGNTGNDHGKGDHSTHVGPVFNSSMVQGDTWGDIIPPHDNYGGLNWTAEGQAVYNDGGCNGTYVPPEEGVANPGASANNACATGISVTFTNVDGTADAIFNVTDANGNNSVVSVAPDATKQVSYPVKEDTTGVVTVSADGMSLKQFSYPKNCVEAVHIHNNKPPTKTPTKTPTVKPQHQTQAPHVLAAHLTHALPFTGSRTQAMTLMAVSLMLGGLGLLVLGGRRPHGFAATR